jgi:hypothetical protein
MSYRYYYFSLAERFLYLTSLVLMQHGNVSIIKMWSFLKHYDGAQLGKRKTASATPTGD